MRLIRWSFWVTGFAVVFLLAVYLLHPVVLPEYARLFQKQNATKGADAIICLSGERTTRVVESLRLWNQGYANELFVTSEKPRNTEFAKLELNHLQFAEAVTRKMKLEAIWMVLPSLTGGATSTFDEAEDALAYAKEKNWKRIIIVTDEFHTRRALYAFNKIFAELEFKTLDKNKEKEAPKKDSNYEIILDEKGLKNWIAKINKSKAFAIDTETDSVETVSANLIGISLSVTENEGCYIPIAHSYEGCPKQLSMDFVVKNLGPAIEKNQDKAVGQNFLISSNIRN